MSFIVRGIPQQVADEVRRTRLSPGYGHPAHLEVATGTGPCRCCLRTFAPGVDRRLLFTWRPPGDGSSLMAPGPVFIHAEHCEAFAGEGFPDGLSELALAFEARATGGRVTAISAHPGVSAERQLSSLLSQPEVRWVQVRHAVAGCYIASVQEKGPAVSRGA
jgi:hypothetical protein